MNNDNADRPCLISIAERELAAFMSAVSELYGPVQASMAADDWIHAFESAGEPFEFTSVECRKITIVAASRLATRLLASGYKTTRLKEALP